MPYTLPDAKGTVRRFPVSDMLTIATISLAMAYTDTQCKEGGVAVEVDACVSNGDTQWRSLAIRERV